MKMAEKCLCALLIGLLLFMSTAIPAQARRQKNPAAAQAEKRAKQQRKALKRAGKQAKKQHKSQSAHLH